MVKYNKMHSKKSKQTSKIVCEPNNSALFVEPVEWLARKVYPSLPLPSLYYPDLYYPNLYNPYPKLS